MSEAATPSPAPAHGSTQDAADAILGAIGNDDAPDTDTAGPAGDAGRTAAADTADPTPGDPSTTTDPGAQPQTPPTYRVKVRGEDREVTLDELRAGYSRTEDHKAKTAEVARDREAVARQKAEITGRATKLDQLWAQAPHDPVLAEAAKTDWLKLANDDPAEYVARKANVDARVAYWTEVQTERQRVASEQVERHLADSEARLTEAIPEWADPAKRKELGVKLASALREYGFEEGEVRSIADHRHLLVARDAMRWREHEAARKAAEAKRAAPQAQPVMRPGAVRDQNGPSERARRLINRAGRTHKTHDVAAAILANLD